MLGSARTSSAVEVGQTGSAIEAARSDCSRILESFGSARSLALLPWEAGLRQRSEPPERPFAVS